MKKENKLGKFVAFVLLITLVALILVANTYAKYTTETNLTAEATVAKWSIKVNDNDIKDSTTFNLFDTIYDTTTAGGEETDVSTGKIAPGTKGSFSMIIKNESEVTAEYTISYKVEGARVPLEFSTDDGLTWTKTLNATEAKTLAKEGGNDTVTVQWRWAFSGNESTNYTTTQTDKSDTDLGEAASTVTVTATLTASQVN